MLLNKDYYILMSDIYLNADAETRNLPKINWSGYRRNKSSFSPHHPIWKANEWGSSSRVSVWAPGNNGNGLEVYLQIAIMIRIYMNKVC